MECVVVIHVTCNCGHAIGGALVEVRVHTDTYIRKLSGFTTEDGLFIGYFLRSAGLATRVVRFDGTVLACGKEKRFTQAGGTIARPSQNFHRNFSAELTSPAIRNRIPSVKEIETRIVRNYGSIVKPRDSWVLGKAVQVICHADCGPFTPALHRTNTYTVLKPTYRLKTDWMPVNIYPGIPLGPNLQDLGPVPPPVPHVQWFYKLENRGQRSITDFKLCFAEDGGGKIKNVIVTSGQEGVPTPKPNPNELVDAVRMRIPPGWYWRWDKNCLVLETEGEGIPPGAEEFFSLLTKKSAFGIAHCEISHTVNGQHRADPNGGKIPGPIALVPPYIMEPWRGTLLLTGDLDKQLLSDIASLVEERGRSYAQVTDSSSSMVTLIVNKDQENEKAKSHDEEDTNIEPLPPKTSTSKGRKRKG